jgi:hypothetical protein
MFDWNKQDRRNFERDFKQKRVDIPFILHHEFLFLLCNGRDRLEVIKKLHNPIFKSNFGDIY